MTCLARDTSVGSVSRGSRAATGAVLGAGYFALKRLAGHDTLRLTATGIEREWTPLARRFTKVETQSWSLPWSAVRAFKHDRALSRSLRTYEYIEIDLDRDPLRLIATDRHDEAGFAVFRDAFLQHVGAPTTTPRVETPVESRAAAPLSSAAALTGRNDAPHTPTGTARSAPIEQRRSFYAGPLAIGLAFVFTAVSIALLVLAVMGLLSGGSLLRLFLVVLPGTIYPDWRVVHARHGI